MTQTFDVKRQHLGDRMYMPGDERQAREDEVRHLVAKGVLAPVGKAEPKAKDKAEPKVQNKADPKAENKDQG